MNDTDYYGFLTTLCLLICFVVQVLGSRININPLYDIFLALTFGITAVIFTIPRFFKSLNIIKHIKCGKEIHNCMCDVP